MKSLIEGSKISAIQDLIGRTDLETLYELEKESVIDERIREFATNLIDPFTLLNNERKRRLIVRMLPLLKARELASLYGITVSRSLYDELCARVSESDSLGTLYSFFGVVHDERVSRNAETRDSRISPNYGLFDHQRSFG